MGGSRDSDHRTLWPTVGDCPHSEQTAGWKEPLQCSEGPASQNSTLLLLSRPPGRERYNPNWRVHVVLEPLPAWRFRPPPPAATSIDGGKDRPGGVLSAGMEEPSEGCWAPCDFRASAPVASPPCTPFLQCVWAPSSGFLGTPPSRTPLYDLAPARKGCRARVLPSHPVYLFGDLGGGSLVFSLLCLLPAFRPLASRVLACRFSLHLRLLLFHLQGLFLLFYSQLLDQLPAQGGTGGVSRLGMGFA